MMLKNKINWLFCISFILVGCKTEFSNPTLTNIVKPTQVTTTKTITPTLTPTVLQTSYSLPKISDNGILFDEEQSTIKEITSTPKPKNTLGPTSTPFQTSVLSPPQGDSSKYKLSLSDPERLFQIKRENYLKSESVSFEELELTAWLLDDVIDYEWKRVYSPDKYSSSLFHLLPERYGYGWASFDVIEEIIGDFLLKYINDEKIEFEHDAHIEFPEGIYGRSYQAEIDGDNLPEWLIIVRDERRFGKGEFSLALDQSDGMHYTKLVNQLPYFYGFSTIREPEFQIRDINGDGIIDFVIEENGCGFGTCYSVFHVITGYPDGFHLIESTAISGDNYGLLGTYWSEANWSISQENFLPSLEITKYRDMSPWDCITSSTKTYQWIGKTEHVVEYPITHPDTGICYIARAMDVQESLDRKSQIQLLNFAYQHQSGLAEEMKVFVLYRLALLYALEKEDWAARKYIDLLIEFSQKNSVPIANNLLEQIEPLLSEDILHPYKLCLAAESISLLEKDSPWSPFLGFTAFPYEGYQNGYPSSLCDTRDIHLEVLNSITINQEDNLEDLLIKVGMPIDYAFSFRESVSPTSWIIAFSDDDPEYFDMAPICRENGNQLYFYGYSDNLGWFLINSIFSSNHQLLINTDDITGNGVPDLAIVTQSDQDTRCEDQDTYVIELITSQIGDYLITNSGNSSEYVCYPKDKVFIFKDFLEDANQDGIIDWVSNKLVEDKYDIDLLLELDANQSWLINTSWRGSLGPLIGKENILKDITSQIIASNNPTELRDEIIFYRNRWGTNDETGQNIRGLLDYLLALTYELEGNEKQAKDIFYRIWRNQANTFWAHLAASRLEYIP